MINAIDTKNGQTYPSHCSGTTMLIRRIVTLVAGVLQSSRCWHAGVLLVVICPSSANTCLQLKTTLLPIDKPQNVTNVRTQSVAGHAQALRRVLGPAAFAQIWNGLLPLYVLNRNKINLFICGVTLCLLYILVSMSNRSIGTFLGLN